MNKPLSISFISSYLPRQCGIATFTNDLASSIKKLPPGNDYDLSITAMNDTPEGYKYPAEVKFEIKDKTLNHYIEAANYLNLSDSDVINIQHEFGLYGGEAGSNILFLIERLKKPLVTTLHTILDKPSYEQLKIIQEIGDLSSYVIVQSERSLQMLIKTYKLLPEKLKFIPHGAHDVPFLDTAYYKDKFQLSGRKVMLTFGLLSPEKGLEDGINAVADIVSRHPDLMYIILGATHPNVKKQYGEAYRYSLENLVKKHKLEKNVIFINRFVEIQELLDFLLMSDIYLSPYQNKEQIVSGTLTYALACGKAIISTPYWYAQELLSNGKGILVEFKKPESISEAVSKLLTDEDKRNYLRKNAYDFGRKIIWSKAAENYTNIFHNAVEEFKRTSRLIVPPSKDKNIPALPEISFDHLKKLSDSTGIFQHATYNIPNRNEGYCTDDNVRALMALIINKHFLNDNSMDWYIDKYITFVHHSFNTNTGLFRNFLSFERTWLEESGSEDCNGRVIYTLGYIIKNTKSNLMLALAKSLFDTSIKNMSVFKSPRAMAYIILGCIFYLKRFSGASEIKKISRSLTEKLSVLYNSVSSKDWNWFEDYLTYDNARLPHALLTAGRYLNNETYISKGLESLKWLYDTLYDNEKNCLSLIGNDGWYAKGKDKAKYDQQPMEIPALIDACYESFKKTSDMEWINRLSISFSWFLGNNDRQEPLCDLITGGCFDGLTPSMLNQNQGAESSISWLQSLLRMTVIRQELKIMM